MAEQAQQDLQALRAAKAVGSYHPSNSNPSPKLQMIDQEQSHAAGLCHRKNTIPSIAATMVAPASQRKYNLAEYTRSFLTTVTSTC